MMANRARKGTCARRDDKLPCRELGCRARSSESAEPRGFSSSTSERVSWRSTPGTDGFSFNDFMTPSHDAGVRGTRFCSCRSNSCDCSRRAPLRVPARSSLRSAHSTGRRRIAAWAFCHSPRRISYSASQGEAEQEAPCLYEFVGAPEFPCGKAGRIEPIRRTFADRGIAIDDRDRRVVRHSYLRHRDGG